MLVTSFMYDLSIFIITWRNVNSYLATSNLLVVCKANKKTTKNTRKMLSVHISIPIHLKESV